MVCGSVRREVRQYLPQMWDRNSSHIQPRMDGESSHPESIPSASRTVREPCCPPLRGTSPKLDKKKRMGRLMQRNDCNPVLYEMLLYTSYLMLIHMVFIFILFFFLSGYLHACSESEKVTKSRHSLARWCQAPTTTTALLFRKRFHTFNTGLKMSY